MNMDWLFIDTRVPGVCRYGWLGRGRRIRTAKARADLLLPLLEKLGLDHLAGAQGICVAAGPGSFSSVRAGVLAANLLSKIWDKPLVGVTGTDADDTSLLTQRLSRSDFPEVSFVSPVYDAEPNITPARAQRT